MYDKLDKKLPPTGENMSVLYDYDEYGNIYFPYADSDGAYEIDIDWDSANCV